MTTKRTRRTSKTSTPKSTPTAARRASAKPSAAKQPTAPAAAAEKPKRAARTVPVAPPPPRRAIFIDVENTSSEDDLFAVLDALKIDHSTQPTELAAVGNWRAVGQQVGRRLAALGAQLMHSAPARGVRDWSDLWIAVAAGCWLGQAAPGDVLEIVSDDRAFDAVGDAAAARGVIFRRLQHRRGAGAPAVETAEPKPARRSRGGRRRRRGRAEHGVAAAPAAATRSAATPSRPAAHADVEPHSASRDQMIGVISHLTNGEPSRWVNLDVLEKALKAQGFARPPGSPRLVTRLRMLKEVEVDAHGRVRLVPGGHGAAAHPSAHAQHHPSSSAKAAAAEPDERGAESPAPAKRRRRRRSKANHSAAATPAGDA